jgi:hypothetical protein
LILNIHYLNLDMVLAIKNNILRKAKFSNDKKERFSLSRQWDESKRKVLYIMFNPSIADNEKDDPTIRRLINFTIKFNYGGFFVGNIFSLITPYPDQINTLNGSSKKNVRELKKLVNQVDKVVYAWGNLTEEPKFLKDSVFNPECFGKNLNGSPKHPLYLPSDSKLMSFRT